MGRDEDELERRERQMENLLGDLDPLLPFFETPTVTDVYVYGDGRVQVGDFERGPFDAGITLSVAQRTRIVNSLANVSDSPIDGGDEPCKFAVWKEICGAAVSEADVRILLAGKKTGSKKCKSVKSGKDFKAAFVLVKGMVEFVFG